eukprot:Nk52_evm20s1967 gene=Nk52_evmTU20s1967
MSDDEYPPPEVSGISPKYGPSSGGTKLTIRGEGLGLDEEDIIGLTVAGINCLEHFVWVSPQKIIVTTPPGNSKGPVIVTTETGGVGKCNVSFQYEEVEETGPNDMYKEVDLFTEVPVWVEEVDMGMDDDAIDGEIKVVTGYNPNEDPLKLKSIAVQSKKNQARKNAALLAVMYPNGSRKTAQRNFVPAWYLGEIHYATSFDDLKKGIGNLKATIESRKDSLKLLMKENFDKFVACQDSIDSLHEKYCEHKRISGGILTNKLHEKVNDSTKQADILFSPLVNRKVECDSIRTSLNAISRFKFLFNLPLNIRKNIDNGEYDVAIDDYKKAVSLFADAESDVFKAILSEVEEILKKLKDILERTSCNIHTKDIKEVEQCIGYLIELDVNEDACGPVWMSVESWYKQIRQQMLLLRSEYKIPVSDEVLPSYTDSLGEGGRKVVKRTSLGLEQLNQELKATFGDFESNKMKEMGLLTTSTQQLYIAGRNKSIIKFSEVLTKNVELYFATFWELGSLYLNGHFLKESWQMKNVDKDSFMKMFRNLFSTYATLVRNAILPTTGEGKHIFTMAELSKDPDLVIKSAQNLVYFSSSMSEHGSTKEDGSVLSIRQNSKEAISSNSNMLPAAVDIVALFLSTCTKRGMPDESIQTVEQLIVDLRTYCVSLISLYGLEEIKSLRGKETWSKNDEVKSTITSIPLIFECIVTEALLSLQSIVKPGSLSTKHTDDLLITLQDAFLMMLSEYIEALRDLATLEDFSLVRVQSFTVANQLASQAKYGSLTASQSSLADSDDTVGDVPDGQKLLLIMSNCIYSREIIFEKLHSKFKANYGDSIENDYEQLWNALYEVENETFEKYANTIFDSLKKMLETGILGVNSHASKVASPIGCRLFVIEILFAMVKCYRELCYFANSSKTLLLSSLGEKICLKIRSCIEGISKLGSNQGMQLEIDIRCIVIIFEMFFSQETRKEYEENILPLLEKHRGKRYDSNLVKTIIDEFKEDKYFELSCFTER